MKKKVATYKNGVVIRKQEVERAKEAFAKDEVELAKLKGEEKILQGLVDKLKGLVFVSIALERLSRSFKEWYMEQMLGFCSFVVEISLSIYVEQKRLIEKAEEEDRLRKEKEEKRIKEEAEKQAAVEKGTTDASRDVDSKETQDNVQEDENKVGISFCFIVAFLSTFNFADYSYLSLILLPQFK